MVESEERRAPLKVLREKVGNRMKIVELRVELGKDRNVLQCLSSQTND